MTAERRHRLIAPRRRLRRAVALPTLAACLLGLSCNGVKDDASPSDDPARPTDETAAPDSDASDPIETDPETTGETGATDPPDTDAGAPVVAHAPHQRPYVYLFPYHGHLQMCWIQDGADPMCHRDDTRIGGCHTGGYAACDYARLVPRDPVRRVDVVDFSYLLLTHGEDGTADALYAYRDQDSGPYYEAEYPDLMGGRRFADIGQSGFGFLYGLTAAGRILPIPAPTHPLLDDETFSDTTRYVQLTTDSERGACGLTVDGDVHCTDFHDAPFLQLPAVPDPFVRIATDDHGVGCGITTERELYCDEHPAEGSGVVYVPAPDAIQGHVREVALSTRVRCAIAQDDHPVCWSSLAVPIYVESARPLVESTPALPMRDLAVGWFGLGRNLACGTHLADDTLHCWGDSEILDEVPWGTKHYPPDP